MPQPDQIDIIVADLDRYTAGEIKALALNVDANLRANPPLGTPVDTGWARANWVPSVGQPALFDAKKGGRPTGGEIAAQEEASQQGLNEVLAWRLTDGPIFVTNNVPYIGPLNDGHSKQSPPGFVQAALVKAVSETQSRGANWAAFNRRADAFRAGKPRPL